MGIPTQSEKESSFVAAASLKTSDKVGYLFRMGRLSEDHGLPTISHLFFTEASEELKLGTYSNLYQVGDVELAMARLEMAHPGLVTPNVVSVIVESKPTMKSMLSDIFQNTIIRSISLVSVGLLVPFFMDLF